MATTSWRWGRPPAALTPSAPEGLGGAPACELNTASPFQASQPQSVTNTVAAQVATRGSYRALVSRPPAPRGTWAGPPARGPVE